MNNFVSTMLLILLVTGCVSRPPVSDDDVSTSPQVSQDVSKTTHPPTKAQKEEPLLPSSESPYSSKKPPQEVSHSPLLSTKMTLRVLDHGWFQIYYDDGVRLASYVKYSVTRDQISKSFVKRKNKFRADPMLTESKAYKASFNKLGKSFEPYLVVKPVEYSHSGYDQGHLAPAGDFAWDEKASNETFVMSNMAPQKPGLNRTAWRLLEEKVRSWACGEEKITVITGTILGAKPSHLKSGLTIPDQFYKIVIDETPPMKAIGFIYSQSDDKNVISERIAKVRDIEVKAKQDLSLVLDKKERAVVYLPSKLEDWKVDECWPKGKKVFDQKNSKSKTNGSHQKYI